MSEYTNIKLNKESMRTIAFALHRLVDDLVSQGIENVTFGSTYKGLTDADSVLSLAEYFEQDLL